MSRALNGRRAVQAEDTVDAKAMRQKLTRHAEEAAERTVRQEGSQQSRRV